MNHKCANDSRFTPSLNAASDLRAPIRLISKRLIYVLFFGSGAASLTLQVVWFKQLQFVLGSSTLSVSVTIASFFLGLSLGSALGGRAADSISRPLLIYGLLELSLAVVSLAVTIFLSNWNTWVACVAPLLSVTSPMRLPLIVLISLTTLLLPTILMGATLPFLVRFLVHYREILAERVGILYGINTLGAAIGTLVVGFILIGILGVLGTSLFASALYISIGSLGLLIARDEQPVMVGERVQKNTQDKLSLIGKRNLLIGVYAISGFVSIAYEVVWFRMLTNIGNANVHAFSGMLSTYLFGLVLGSFLCAKFLASRKEQLLRYFAVTQFLTAVAGMLTLGLFGKANTLLVWLSPVTAAIIPDCIQAFLAGNVLFFFMCILILLLPTTLIGISFPLASELTAQHMGVLGRRIGMLYSLNTLGGVLGSLIAGFVLIPYLGSQWALILLTLANMVLFVTVTVSQPELRSDRILWREGAGAFCVIMVAYLLFGSHYLDRQLTAFAGAEIRELRESKDATFLVLEYKDEAAGKYQQLLVNSKSYANNRLEGRRYMAALAHYPVLLHGNPSQAVVICIGTGTTIGAITSYDELQSIHAVDLAKDVFDFAQYFVPVNKQFHENTRVQKIVADGRHYLLSTEDKFDVVTLEPPPPLDAGVVNLYSEEFYKFVKQRMRPGAVVAQWVPLDMERGVLSKMILKAMIEQFKHVSLWLPNRMDGIAIGSNEPLQIDRANLAIRMSVPKVAEDLTAIGLRSPEHFLATFVAADATLSAYLADIPSITDDRPRLEYHNLYAVQPISVAEIKRLREPVELYIKGIHPEAKALESARKVVDAIWQEHEEISIGNRNTARSVLDDALMLEPNNAYLQFLNRKQRAINN